MSVSPLRHRYLVVVSALASCAAFFACSLMAPGDDYFLGAPRARFEGAGGGAGDAGGELKGAGADGASTGGADGSGAGEGGDEPDGAGGAGCGEDGVKEGGVCVSVSGCSDGTREAFLPLDAWPTLAGCTAKWPRASLRAPKTGTPCGFVLGVCAAPADACGDGWHVCASPPYEPTEISERATAEECAAQPGAYAAAVGDQSCEPCSEAGSGAACCGVGCVHQKGSCIYPGQTSWFGVINGYTNLCGAIESSYAQRGVLCCRDR